MTHLILGVADLLWVFAWSRSHTCFLGAISTIHETSPAQYFYSSFLHDLSKEYNDCFVNEGYRDQESDSSRLGPFVHNWFPGQANESYWKTDHFKRPICCRPYYRLYLLHFLDLWHALGSTNDSASRIVTRQPRSMIFYISLPSEIPDSHLILPEFV